jgi:citrate synthase
MKRFYSTDIRHALKKVIPSKVEQLQALRKSTKPLGQLTVEATLGGMRGYSALFWQSSAVDPEKGVTFHGKTIKECQKELPKCRTELDDPHSEFLPESMFWFLLTGETPSQQQVNALTEELAQKSALPDYLIKVLDSLPSSLHPMTQLSIAISALNNESTFAHAYAKGIPKTEYWEYTLEDSINLVAKMPGIIGRIYSNTYHNGKPLGQLSEQKDWSHNMATVLGFTQDSANINNLSASQSQDFTNLIRLYCALHADHEGGNVSAHATHLVGSALSDAYLSYSSGVQGLAGPLHGLAAQEVVRFIVEMKDKINGDIHNNAKIEEYLWSLLNSKRVIPGYGHGVLRKPDPRFDAMMQFGFNRPQEFENDDYFQLVNNLSKVAPDVLKVHGKTKNPFPNVDSSSGILFYHYGLKELLFFTVIFGGSRSMGPLAQLVWDRIYGLPIERPKSVTLEMIKSL